MSFFLGPIESTHVSDRSKRKRQNARAGVHLFEESQNLQALSILFID